MEHIAQGFIAHSSVERDGDRPEAHRAESGLQEAVIVAEHQRHSLALAHADLAKGVGHAITSSFELLERKDGVVLEDGGPVRGEA